eukprot:TRINITY_DN2083_c0_g1_i1.p1 TRINITY_DN2083_c0_g1~~TRINITY_DN2083_c0_g1_i1.p1  ORF type:complete len:258 (+),score=50.58 TRINITY_DN2083_c0_g1_i1:98-775(+)
MGDDVYKLLYFNIRGRAEPARICLELSDNVWEHEPVENWSKIKSEQLFGQLPRLTHREHHVWQSTAIFRYIGRQTGLYPSSLDPKSLSMIDMLISHEQDCRQHYTNIIYSRAQFTDYTTDVKNYKDSQNIRKYFTPIDTVWKRSQTQGLKWFIGNDLTILDVVLWVLIDDHLSLDPNVLNEFPDLLSFYRQFKAVPKVSNYLNSERRPKKLNGNGKGQEGEAQHL